MSPCHRHQTQKAIHEQVKEEESGEATAKEKIGFEEKEQQKV